MQIEQMPMVRVFFEKTGRAKYTSHLDTMRTLTRGFRRSGLPLWYTQGFNPHLYMTFALPIALGCESLCESVDIRLTEEMPMDAVVERLNTALPPGLRALRAAPPRMEPAAITWADYDVTLYGDAAHLGEQWKAFTGRDTIEVVKKTKKGEKTVDLRPLLQVQGTEESGDGLALRIRLAAGIQLNIAPSLLLGAFARHTGAAPERARVVRTAILTEAGEDFA